MNSSLQEAIKLVEAGETEKGLQTLAQAEKHLHDEEKRRQLSYIMTGEILIKHGISLVIYMIYIQKKQD